MRLPWGTLDEIMTVFLGQSEYTLLGCLSFEDRCCAVPIRVGGGKCAAVELLEIIDPPDAVPNRSVQARSRIEKNRKRLTDIGLRFRTREAQLLIAEEGLLDIIQEYDQLRRARTLVVDITSMPKRYFCFLLKRILLVQPFENVVVTYTQAGHNGYTSAHLAEDPMTADHLPGFGPPPPPGADTLVISVGFESLSIRSLVEVYRDRRKATKIIVSFPADTMAVRRAWRTLRQLTDGSSQDLDPGDIAIIATWDAEEIYSTLEQWSEDSEGLALAPFGPKPHSLGMALFATRYECGLYYTQPKSYNPEYSKGTGESWAYIAKWGGVPCFDRRGIGQ